VMKIDPWPFAKSRIELDVPARRLPATPWADEGAFREAYARAETFQHALTFLPG
jgi:hypothetical protein